MSLLPLCTTHFEYDTLIFTHVMDCLLLCKNILNMLMMKIWKNIHFGNILKIIKIMTTNLKVKCIVNSYLSFYVYYCKCWLKIFLWQKCTNYFWEVLDSNKMRKNEGNLSLPFLCGAGPTSVVEYIFCTRGKTVIAICIMTKLDALSSCLLASQK